MDTCQGMELLPLNKVSLDCHLKHSPSIDESLHLAVTGLGAAYGLEAEIAAILAAYAIAIDGNVLEQVWSIGGPLPADFLGGLIGTGQG